MWITATLSEDTQLQRVNFLQMVWLFPVPNGDRLPLVGRGLREMNSRDPVGVEPNRQVSLRMPQTKQRQSLMSEVTHPVDQLWTDHVGVILPANCEWTRHGVVHHNISRLQVRCQTLAA